MSRIKKELLKYSNKKVNYIQAWEKLSLHRILHNTQFHKTTENKMNKQRTGFP